MAGEFPIGWQLMTLEESMAAIIDYRGKTPRKTDTGIPLITAKIVKNGRIETPNEFIDPREYDLWMQRGLPQSGDVVVTTEAPLGEVAQLDGRKVALAQRLIALRGKPGFLDNGFLKFAMLSFFVQDQLVARSTGTTVTGIKQSELRKILLPIPPLHQQHAIAHILGTLDDKIELNRRMNETLEAMAQAIFKSWFVDFDPVRAKMEGRISGLANPIAELFSDSFRNFDIGRIPCGWTTGFLGDIAENPRRVIRPEDIENTTPYIGLEHMPRRCIALSEWEHADGLESNKYRFRKGEILFGKLRPYFHKVGIAPLEGVCSTDILVVTPKSLDFLGCVLGHVSSLNFINFVDIGSTGTKMPRTSWPEMARYPIAIPPVSLAAAFSRLISPFIEQIVSGIHESKLLSSVRNTLLPKLLSGEIRVKEAEKIVGAAV